MIWKKTHISKVYEALGAIADKRIELVSETQARCYSSSKGKFYTINYDPDSNLIMSNDNTAYYAGALSYPMIAMLMLKGKLTYELKVLEPLKDIAWKDINQKFKNDYDKVMVYVLNDLTSKGFDREFLENEVDKIYEEVCLMKLGYLGEKQVPPAAY